MEVLEPIIDVVLDLPVTGWLFIFGSGLLYLFTFHAMDADQEHSATIFGTLLMAVGIGWMFLGSQVLAITGAVLGIILVGVSLWGIVLLVRSWYRYMMKFLSLK